jgi:hypothetical protein
MDYHVAKGRWRGAAVGGDRLRDSPRKRNERFPMRINGMARRFLGYPIFEIFFMVAALSAAVGIILLGIRGCIQDVP